MKPMKYPLVAVAVFAALSGCGMGVVTTEDVTVTPSGAASSENASAGEPSLDLDVILSKRQKWPRWPRRADGGLVVPPEVVDAGTPVPPVVPDAGTVTPPVRVDAGTPVPPVAPDAGTVTPPVRVDAGTPVPPVVPDAGTVTPPVVVDAGTPITPGNPGAADVTIAINSGVGAAAISRYIYGNNFIANFAQQPNLTLNRLGGNRWSAYNWENNASNAGTDYYSNSDSYLGGGNTPGEAVRSHVADARAAGAATLVTVPILGWAAADTLGTSVVGQAITSRFKQSVAVKGSAFTTAPSLTDATVYQDEFVAFLEGAFPNAHQDPARDIFYSLDNEPDLWSGTHPVIHPSPVTYAELLSKTIEYSTAIKAVAPLARVFGFVSYGFLGYVSLQEAPDAAGRDFTNFFLDGVRVASAAAGKRLVDVLDLHWYPEATGGGVRIIDESTSAAVVAARVQAPRSLWDPTYVETSWISDYSGNQPLKLIPSMKSKIAAHYAGTGLAFSEYYYGGGAHISGGVAQADVLGIFGREGVFAATLWPMTTSIPYLLGAFAMYRSYDGSGGTFGDVSVQATNSDVANASAYASIDSTSANRMVVVLINKATTAKTAAVAITHGTVFGHAEVYTLTSASSSPVHGANVATTTTNALRYTMPAMSVTTLVFRP